MGRPHDAKRRPGMNRTALKVVDDDNLKPTRIGHISTVRNADVAAARQTGTTILARCGEEFVPIDPPFVAVCIACLRNSMYAANLTRLLRSAE